MPWQEHGDVMKAEHTGTDADIEVTKEIREWDYGDYEGVTSPEIRKRREENGEGSWDIWRDGCPGGEYVCGFEKLYEMERHRSTDECLDHHNRSQIVSTT